MVDSTDRCVGKGGTIFYLLVSQKGKAKEVLHCTSRGRSSVVAKVNLSRKNDDKIKYEWGISEGTALDPARARPSKFAKITPICTQIQ